MQKLRNDGDARAKDSGPEGTLTVLVDRPLGNLRMILESTDDALEALLTLKRSGEAVVTSEDVYNLLSEAEIVHGIQNSVIERAVAAFNDGGEVSRRPVALGEDVVDGVDAYVEFEKPPTGTVHQENLPDDPSAIDYKEVDRFSNVRPGESIGHLVPVRDGVAGTDIFGRITPPQDGREITVALDETVEFDEVTQEYIAREEGHVVYSRGKLYVDPVYHVKEDVDLNHGHIRFVGLVDVKRDVLEDFEVSGQKGVRIGGTAEACQVRSGTDIVIEGGVAGKGRAKIEADGGIWARFLNEAAVVAAGDVVVHKEIVNSRVYTHGRVIVERGTIVGGEIVALKGIVVRDLGSDLGVKTRLASGVDYREVHRLFDLNKDLRKLRERQQRFLQQIGPLLDRALRAAVVDNALRARIEELWPEVQSFQEQIEALEEESDELNRNIADEAVPRIEVTGEVFSGTEVTLGTYTSSFGGGLKGPLAFEPDPEHRGVRVASLAKTSGIVEHVPDPPRWAQA